MDQRDLLRLAEGHPTAEFSNGDVVVAEGSERSSLFVLARGELVIRSGGTDIARVTEPGSVVGEIGLLLEAPATADVVAGGPTVVHRIDDPRSLFEQHPEFGMHLAVVLARRLRRITTFLGDMQRQYGDRTDALGLLPDVVSTLLSEPAAEIEGGSEREPDSPY